MMRPSSAVRLLFCAVCFFFVAASANAQYRGSLQGVVSDAQGAVIPGSRVTLINKETNRTMETTSDGGGNYTFSSLPPSHYRLEVSKDGFKKKVIDDVAIISEQANGANVELEIGQATETVTVNGAAAPLIDTETATVSGTVNSNQIQKLPSFGRDVYQLAQLAPGAFGDGSQSAGGGTQNLPGTNPGGSGSSAGIFGVENAPQIVANGTGLQGNNISIDGVSVTSISWGGAAVVTPNEESVKEVKVVTNSYDAENGRFSGAQIQVISNNGTNQYHGSAFFKADRPGLNAYQKWNGPSSEVPGTPQQRGLQRNNSRFNDFGGSLGGPIWKNKVFGFFSYETLRNNAVTNDNNWYETPQFLSMAPAGSIASTMLSFPGEGVKFGAILSKTCADIGLAVGTQCNTVPGQGLDVGSPLPTPLGTLDGSYGGGSGTPGVGGGLDGIPDIMFANTINPSVNTDAQYNGRVDFNVTGKDLVALSMYRVPDKSTNFNGPVRPANLWHHSSTAEAETALWNHTFSPTLINEARMNAANWRWNEIASNSQEPWGLPQNNIDCIGSACPQYFGAPGPSVFSQWTYNIKDTLTKVHGSHLLKFGGEVTRLEFLDEAPWSARPSYTFRNLWDFANDAPYKEEGNFDPNPNSATAGQPTEVRKDTRANIYGFFVQDDWKLRSNLTINLGLRWEYFGPLSDKGGRLSTLELGSGADALTGMSLRLGGNMWEAQKANFGPQIGFAWSPSALGSHEFNNKLVVRGGFGIGYTGLEQAISLNGRGNPPLVSFFSLCCSTSGQPVMPSIIYGVPADVHSFNGYPSNPTTVSVYNSNNLPASGSPVSVTGFPSNLPTSYTYHYSLDTQYDLGRTWVATLGYQGSTSHHFTRQYQQNIVYAAQGPTTATAHSCPGRRQAIRPL
jgi:hypothetical protein